LDAMARGMMRKAIDELHMAQVRISMFAQDYPDPGTLINEDH
jgi:hypothetical protein